MRRDAKRKTLDVRSSIAPVEMPGLDSHLCFALYAASNHMTRLFVPFLQKLGVTYPQYLVLVVLWERGPQGVGILRHCYEWILVLFRQCSNGSRARASSPDVGRLRMNDAYLSI